MSPSKALLPLLVYMAMCASCATVNMSKPTGYKTILYSYHGPNGAQEAARSLEADGRIEGSHLSGSGAPIISIGSETARPEDLKEIAEFVEHLPLESSPVATSGGYLQLQIFMADGSVRTYRATDRQHFTHPLVQRLHQIMSSYRAGYW